MILRLFIIFCFSFQAFAQTMDTSQSSSSLNWKSIENERVIVIFPDYESQKAIYIANLIEHYSHYVGLTYQIEKPEKITLILRPEVSSPNGFVTLAPRRTEWFSSASIFPFVGASEWYQTLAIHEYRHILQFDTFNTDNAKIFYYLFGDFGRMIARYLGLQSWYFEGDAVWAETKYTDAGRGRSPRFLARLKALVLSDQIPTYDEILNGTYKTSLPNIYVLGYAIISYSTQKFGENIWHDITKNVAKAPHPFKFYSVFEEETGQSFYDFYEEMMNDLKSKWSADKVSRHKGAVYSESFNPIKINDNLFYVSKDLDSYWSIYQKNKNEIKRLTQVPYNPGMTDVHFAQNKAVYSQFLPDTRYGMVGYSDLILVNLKIGTKEKITNAKRYYHPKLNKNANKILTTFFNDKNEWSLVELDLKGSIIRKVEIKDNIIAQAYYLDDNTVAAIIVDPAGNKAIAKLDLEKEMITKTLLPFSRNSIASVYVDSKKNILFEAQYKGKIEIFIVDKNEKISQCTNSMISAFNPSSDGQTIFYSDMNSDGANIENVKLSECKILDKKKLINFNYLSKSPSDNYNNFPLQSFKEQKSLYNANQERYDPKDYSHFDERLFVPHSWRFFSGNGLELGVTSDNYLRTVAFDAAVGYTFEENQPFASLKLDYRRYYPIISIIADKTNRSTTPYQSNKELSWQEASTGLAITLPYFSVRNLYSLSSSLTLIGNYLDTREYRIDGDSVSGSSDAKNFYQSSAQFEFAIYKDLNYRSIISPYALSYNAQYDNAQNKDELYSSYRFYHNTALQVPGFLNHNVTKFTYSYEDQDKSALAYHFAPIAMGPAGSAFSRGYGYKNVNRYQKLTANYLFPIAYPDFTLQEYLYIRRLTGNLFYDNTLLLGVENKPNYESYGLELEAETSVIRLIPLNIGLRALQKNNENKTIAELYLATSLIF